MNILLIVQARLGSTRLPKKVLLKINHKTILEYIIEFLKLSKFPDKIIVATTDISEDDEIEDLCKRLSIDCFRGSSSDVLKRYYECAKFYNGDIIVRITADDPLIDIDILDNVIQTCIDTKFDLISTGIHPSFPHGYFIEAFPFSVLEQLHQNQHDDQSREHVTYHIKQNSELFKIKEISPGKGLERPDWRLTIDYIEDFELVSKIIHELYQPGYFIKYEHVIKFLDENKELIRHNQHN